MYLKIISELKEKIVENTQRIMNLKKKAEAAQANAQANAAFYNYGSRHPAYIFFANSFAEDATSYRRQANYIEKENEELVRQLEKKNDLGRQPNMHRPGIMHKHKDHHRFSPAARRHRRRAT